MKGETYYFMFSVVFFTEVLLYLGMFGYYRLTGRTLYGIKYKRNSVEYKNIHRVFRKRNIIIALILLPVFGVNLLLEVRYLEEIHNPGNILTIIPVLLAVTTLITFIKVYDQFRPKNKRQSDSKNDWPIV
jgi:hypothetical protein